MMGELSMASGDLFRGDSIVPEAENGSILGAVFEAMADGVVVQNRTGSILACNTSAERILGLTADQMMGRTSTDPRWGLSMMTGLHSQERVIPPW